MYIEGMTARQTDRLQRECLKFGMGFPEEDFHNASEVATIIRWAKSNDRPSKELVRQRLEEAGCFEVLAPSSMAWDFFVLALIWLGACACKLLCWVS